MVNVWSCVLSYISCKGTGDPNTSRRNYLNKNAIKFNHVTNKLYLKELNKK